MSAITGVSSTYNTKIMAHFLILLHNKKNHERPILVLAPIHFRVELLHKLDGNETSVSRMLAFYAKRPKQTKEEDSFEESIICQSKIYYGDRYLAKQDVHGIIVLYHDSDEMLKSHEE